MTLIRVRPVAVSSTVASSSPVSRHQSLLAPADASEGSRVETAMPANQSTSNEVPGTDTPPHNIARPWRDNGNEDRLGECMDREPTLPFDVEIGVRLAESAMLEYPATRWVQWARSREEADRLWPTPQNPLGEVDYDETSVIVVQSGPRSGGRNHHWVRVEDVPDGLHVHGYQLDPENAQADASDSESVITVDYVGKPGETVVVSYTTSRSTREHFTAENGPISIDDEPDQSGSEEPSR